MAIRKEAAEVAVDERKLAGTMIIHFWDYGGSIIPEVMFDPVGRITPNAIDRHLPHIYHQINIAQNQARKS